jgi:hypothetical protein
VIVASFGLRGFRLAEPFDMYFDEVYHARTATEFLQHWRYGLTHSIYEYTHPHLAKYAMALGIEAFGDNRVTDTSSLGATVDDAVIEPRWSPPGDPGAREGDRLYVVGGGRLLALDLVDRDPVAALDVDATAVAVDDEGHQLYVVGPDGQVSSLDTTALDTLRRDPSQPPPSMVPIARLALEAPATSLAVADGILLALSDDGSLASLDLATDQQSAHTSVTGARAMATLATIQAIVARPDEIDDPGAAAEVLADDLNDDPSRIEDLLTLDQPEVTLVGWPDEAARTAVQGHIDDGSLTGVEIAGARTPVALASADGLVILDAATLSELDTLDLGGPAYGLALVEKGLSDDTLYVSTDRQVRTVPIKSNGARSAAAITMPGPVGQVLWNSPSNLVHVVGTAPDGSDTVYVIEPHGNAVFADARLAFEPAAAVMDVQPDRPSDDRTQLLAMAADGRVASIEIGSTAFGWRLPGVLMGTVTAAGLFLLARLLFRRRSIAVFTAALVLTEGMLFANVRIGMNDAYVVGFLVAAVVLFAPIWLGSWRRWWQVIPCLVAIGVLLGLALASKWVAAYAIGGLVLLVLLRSALGRLIALCGMLAISSVLGALAVRSADVESPNRNWLFLLLMLTLTLVLAAAIVRRPIRASRAELGFAVIAPVLVGALLAGASMLWGDRLPTDGLITADRVLLAGGALVAGGLALGLLAWVAGRFGWGPLATRTVIGPDLPVPAPPATGWLSPGRLLGAPWLFALACLTAVPVFVYVLSYYPWIELGNQWWTGFPEGHTGQTLAQLTMSMYHYHDELRVGHAASSPWWAWPLDLKPVWFYQDGFANNTTGAIYDGGNVVVFWMGIAGLLFAALAAWRRRSLSLALVVLLFAAMWLPWSRIDRATFQYHWYSSLPFVVLALGYLLAELWHGPSGLAWGIARGAAALAIVGAPLLWLFREPLCVLAGATDNAACGPLTRSTNLTEQAFAALIVLALGAAVATLLMWAASRGRLPRSWHEPGTLPTGLLLLTAGLTLVGVFMALFLVGPERTLRLEFGANPLALVALVLLLIPAGLVLRARDPRRLALGIVGAAAVFLLIWYPNLTGLPIPSGLSNAFTGLLPTWNYYFQFAVNLDPPVEGSLIDGATIVVAAIGAAGVVGTMIAARHWGRLRARQPESLTESA